MSSSHRASLWLLVAALCWASCSDESASKKLADAGDDRADGGDDTKEDTGRDLEGTVFDAENGSPIAAAALQTEDFSSTSDDEGHFELITRSGTELRAKGKSYAATVKPLPAGRALIDVFLKSLDASIDFRGDEGVTVHLPSGASLEIPKDSVVTQDGKRVSGKVKLEVASVDGDKATQAAALPGNGVAQTKDKTDGRLSIERALSIRISDSDGKDLSVDEKKDVIAELPVTDKGKDANLTVYSYDESNKRWKEEGKAERTTNDKGEAVYRADIEHLSWWSVGRFSSNTTCVRACVENEAGQPVVGAQIWIVGASEPGVSTFFTDAKGCGAGDDMADVDVVLLAQAKTLVSDSKSLRIGHVKAHASANPDSCQDAGTLRVGPSESRSCPLCVLAGLPAGLPEAMGDAGTMFDGGATADAGSPFDASVNADAAMPLDGSSGAPDAQVTTLTLSVPTQTVTTSPITLTATQTGIAASSVSFYEGAKSLGQDTSAPFERTLTFSYVDNGPHTYDAESTGPAGDVHAKPLTINVAMPPNGYFVDPVLGLDSHDGSLNAPFQTLQKAASAATAGQTIYLKDGEYNTTNQPTFQVSFAAGVTLRGLSPTGVVFKGTSSTNQIDFSNGGALYNVTFDTFNQAVAVRGTSTFAMRNVQFIAVSTALFVQGATVATIDGTVRQLIVSPVNSVNQTIWIEGTSQVDFTGNLADLQVPGSAIFLVRGKAHLTVHDSLFTNIDRSMFHCVDNSHLLLRKVTLDDIAIPSSNPLSTDSGVITTGGQNTEDPLDYSIELEDTSITNSALTGIIASLYSSKATQALIKLTNSHIDSNTGHGIRVDAVAPSDPGLHVRVELSNSTIKGSGSHGLFLQNVDVNIVGGEISSNAGNGVDIGGTSFKNTLKVRGGTLISDNSSAGILFDGAATSVLDLGKTGDPGGIVFSLVSADFQAVRLAAPIAGYAVGNTWLPNVQGADVNGLYSGAVTIPADTFGQNVTITDNNASLVLSE